MMDQNYSTLKRTKCVMEENKKPKFHNDKTRAKVNFSLNVIIFNRNCFKLVTITLKIIINETNYKKINSLKNI